MKYSKYKSGNADDRDAAFDRASKAYAEIATHPARDRLVLDEIVERLCYTPDGFAHHLAAFWLAVVDRAEGTDNFRGQRIVEAKDIEEALRAGAEERRLAERHTKRSPRR